MVENTHTGSLLILKEEQTQKIDEEVYMDIITGETVLMLIIIICRFLYLISHPRKIKKIK